MLQRIDTRRQSGDDVERVTQAALEPGDGVVRGAHFGYWLKGLDVVGVFRGCRRDGRHILIASRRGHGGWLRHRGWLRVVVFVVVAQLLCGLLRLHAPDRRRDCVFVRTAECHPRCACGGIGSSLLRLHARDRRRDGILIRPVPRIPVVRSGWRDIGLGIGAGGRIIMRGVRCGLVRVRERVHQRFPLALGRAVSVLRLRRALTRGLGFGNPADRRLDQVLIDVVWHARGSPSIRADQIPSQ